MRVSRLSLQAKIILLTGLTVMLVAAVSTYFALWLTRDPIEAEIYRKALVQAELTAHQLVNNGQLQTPQTLLHSLRDAQRAFPGVKQASVYAQVPQKQLLATTNPKSELVELDALPNVRHANAYFKPNANQMSIETPGGRYWIISTAIHSNGRKVGSLILKVSKSPLNAVTWQLVGQDLVLLLLSLGAVILVIHVFFLREIRRPVKEMIRVMERAQQGELDRRARVSSGDEVGQLAGHLNRMLERIENFSTELNRKVEDATAELARRNEELRRINQELFETQKTLARSERLAIAGQLAASLAHEIGTPLNSISGHVQLLGRQKSGDASSARRLQIIERQIESIVRTVKQLLSWTRQFDLRFEPVDLRRLLEESLLLSSPTLQRRKIRVETEWDKSCPRIEGDPGYLQQVFLNLINNALDALPQGGRLIARVRGPSLERPSQVRIEIEDSGVGIPPDALARIFEPMFTTKRIGAGAGLGLAICEQIIRQHGGTIRAESEPGRGTCFTLLLPLEGPPHTVEAEAAREAPAHSPV